MQTDCNLVLYDGEIAVWSSGTYNQGSGCYAKMQSDGNLVVYGGYNNALWATNTEREQGNYICVLQRDRNVVIYGPALWASGLTAWELPVLLYRPRTLLRRRRDDRIQISEHRHGDKLN
uniref:non-specific serine/threonine protein kinase n=1 Tax=Ananas comosus var. bracteatus TaxID=296719 RepID=A0A6V7NGH5_ANACO|nr:unnamed protein product [Ananas comosus var. bracteatus]